ncbi:hypothetical protein NC651_004803 [Populus alba x Populus x berolinensis]|nr:hypothetical protein NC651_004803 [Populus alba x Populus x berolinensis]
MALPFDVKFFLMDMRFEHDRSERFHKQEYEALRHDLISDIPCSSSEMYYSSSSPELHLRAFNPEIWFLFEGQEGFSPNEVQASGINSRSVLEKKTGKSDNLAAE